MSDTHSIQARRVVDILVEERRELVAEAGRRALRHEGAADLLDRIVRLQDWIASLDAVRWDELRRERS